MKNRSSFRSLAFQAMLEDDSTPQENFVCPVCARDLVKGECPVHGEQPRLCQNERFRQTADSRRG